MTLDITNTIAMVAAIVAAVSAVASLIGANAAKDQVKLMREELDKRERPYIYGSFRDVH